MFSAIILFHYVNYQPHWTSERELSTNDISIERRQGNTVTILSELGFRRDLGLSMYKGKVEGPDRGFYVGSPAIKDVRMPLFVLAVFYVGLFFISGEQKPRG